MTNNKRYQCCSEEEVPELRLLSICYYIFPSFFLPSYVFLCQIQTLLYRRKWVGSMVLFLFVYDAHIYFICDQIVYFQLPLMMNSHKKPPRRKKYPIADFLLFDQHLSSLLLIVYAYVFHTSLFLL